MVKKSTFTREKQEEAKLPSYIKWSIFLIATLIILFWKCLPLFMEWQKERNLLEQYKTEIPALEKDLALKEAELIEVENEFKELANPFLIRENQMYPKYVDIKKVSKILELYSLQMALVENTPFEVLKISFGGGSEVKDKKYSRTGVDINFVANDKLLRGFIHFLQTGEFSKKFEAARNTGQLDPRAYTFLKENILPIAQIQSIKIIDEEVDGVTGQISVNIQFHLFSQKSVKK